MARTDKSYCYPGNVRFTATASAALVSDYSDQMTSCNYCPRRASERRISRLLQRLSKLAISTRRQQKVIITHQTSSVIINTIVEHCRAPIIDRTRAWALAVYMSNSRLLNNGKTKVKSLVDSLCRYSSPVAPITSVVSELNEIHPQTISSCKTIEHKRKHYILYWSTWPPVSALAWPWKWLQLL